MLCDISVTVHAPGSFGRDTPESVFIRAEIDHRYLIETRVSTITCIMADTTQIADLRKDYKRLSLDETDTSADPFAQFRIWFDQALNAGVIEPNAMTVATVDVRSNQPSARILLLKGLDDRGFVFFTNFASQKGEELTTNPRVALLFFWADLERQVRVEGAVEKVSRDESERYFHSRPRASQIGAWASQQSTVLANRAELEHLKAQREAEFAGIEVPLPEYWGGYRVIPTRLEFWQGRQSRLHDRIVYVRNGNEWKRERLSP